MKKILVVPTLAILTSVPLSAQSWCGPWGGTSYPYAAPAPYWGGYAPPMYAPPYPAYAPPPGYAKHWGPDDMYDNEDDFAGPDGKDRFEFNDTDRKQMMEAAAARRAAFHARIEARRAEMKAKRDAWRQQMEQMEPMNRYSGQPLAPESSAITEPKPPQTPPAVAAPVEPPKAAATAKQ